MPEDHMQTTFLKKFILVEISQQTLTCSKSNRETLGKGVNYVHQSVNIFHTFYYNYYCFCYYFEQVSVCQNVARTQSYLQY